MHTHGVTLPRTLDHFTAVIHLTKLALGFRFVTSLDDQIVHHHTDASANTETEFRH